MTPDTIKEFVDAVEALDLDAALAFFSPQAQLYFCNTLIASGRPAIRRFLLPLFTRLEELRHQTVAAWSQGGVSVIEADVRYSCDNEGWAAMPVTSVLHWTCDRIQECRVNTWRALFPGIRAA